MKGDIEQSTMGLLHEITHHQNRKRYFLSLSIAPTVALLLLYLTRNTLPPITHILMLVIPYIHLFLLAQLYKHLYYSQSSAERLVRYLMAHEPDSEHNEIIVKLFITNYNTKLNLKEKGRYTLELTILILPLILTPIAYLILVDGNPSSLEIQLMLVLLLSTIILIIMLILQYDKHNTTRNNQL